MIHSMIINTLRLSLLALCLLCSPMYASDAHTAESTATSDPLESFNRFSHGFNHQLDMIIFKPVAQVYRVIVPPFLRKGVSHFFRNVGEVPTIVNGVLQGKVAQATSDVGRLLLNTTVGVGGVFDVATPIGLEKHHEDFGLTLARWGWKESSYLELPVLGPSTIRDGLGFIPNYFTTVWPYAFDHLADRYTYPIFALNLIDKRSNLLKTDKVVETVSLDRYIVVRNAYLQKRANLIDGQSNDSLEDTSLNDDDDIYIDEDDI